MSLEAPLGRGEGLDTFTPAEVEFMAENEYVRIIPNFAQMETIHFIQGDIGPWRAGHPTSVPLWLAVTLKKRGKCKLIPPEWLTPDEMDRSLEVEGGQGSFQLLPPHYLVVANILLSCASDDIPQADKVRTGLQDLFDIRFSKIRTGLYQIEKSTAVRVDNLSLMEINTIRPFFVQAMNQFLTLHSKDDA